MKYTSALLLLLSMLSASISLADSPNDDPVLKAAAIKAGLAIKFCGENGPSSCNQELIKTTNLLVAAFDLQKPALARLPCGSTDWDTIPELYIVVVKEFGQGIARMMDYTQTFGGSPSLTKREAAIYVNEFSATFDKLLAFGADVHLSIGDQALKSGCRKEADKNYRAVLARFTGARLASYRERAQVGIADVRSSSGIICKLTGYC